ncbi:F-type H+-transporting ATPase subunit gamma [Nitrosomonas cryotolerans]|uniref:F-type H+-transporting ATPase subunit gamma n=1 Tax=Nitrosomonas cryotolerans ATCC 49181 TaxID=1131553 RepID=A0A1N6HSK5_9PROT|nr:FoF1 ATP synthase subunit gamma [Nitrosomonas cryotolerans]SFP95684.1 F-type H+-transporting ATPase subunit gamma [Nitrosomonas cryotolerans]SIO22635.1 F-type H+-transporting ATPase subunit gamma [Nitrosomonas cryotolerans ATCC 49181]
MSKRREVKERLATLDEIDGIMSAMKNLALLEIHKLETFSATQHRAVASIESAAQDLLAFYPQMYRSADDLQQLWIIIGSERGFCGNFNESLLQFLNMNAPQADTLLLAVGRRLEAKLHDDARISDFIAGHSVAEEVPVTLLRLSAVLNRLQRQLELAKIACISVVYYDNKSDQIRLRQLLPLTTLDTKSAYSHPPQLNLEPSLFLSELTDQYLYAVLHEVFYSSLMMENHKRLEHMDRAIHRLKKDEARLRLRYNRLRQEEIIEEIEIIMLSVEALSDDESRPAVSRPSF